MCAAGQGEVKREDGPRCGPYMGRGMAKISAGLLMYRRGASGVEVLLVHPGGPLWKNKEKGAWSIPKGEVHLGEDLLEAARREFEEELGSVAAGEFIPLAPIRQKSGKVVHAWAVEGSIDTASIRSNTFEMEWPPKSGKRVAFAEVDRAEFVDVETAKRRINPAQVALVEELSRILAGGGGKNALF